METPKIKRVEEEFGKPQLIHSPHHAHAQSWPDRNETIIQDRASLHTSLVAAVEDYFKGLVAIPNPPATRDNLLTIINNIFKE